MHVWRGTPIYYCDINKLIFLIQKFEILEFILRKCKTLQISYSMTEARKASDHFTTCWNLAATKYTHLYEVSKRNITQPLMLLLWEDSRRAVGCHCTHGKEMWFRLLWSSRCRCWGTTFLSILCGPKANNWAH